MTNNKWLHTFTIKKEIDKKVTEKQKGEKGEDIEITKTVKETVPISFHIKKPNRKLYDKAELFYGVKMSEGIKAGLLTRSLLAKRYDDDGGAFSESEKQKYSELYSAIYSKENEYQRLQVNLDNKDQDLKESLSESLLKELAALRRQLIEIENSQSNIFDQTAENRAKNQTIMWWVLNLSHWKEHGHEDPKPFFKGAEHDERLESYDTYEDSDDNFFNEAIRKLAFFISFWYMGKVSSEEDFKSVEKLYSEQNPTEEETTEEAVKEPTETAPEKSTEVVAEKAVEEEKAEIKIKKKASKEKTTKEEPLNTEENKQVLTTQTDNET